MNDNLSQQLLGMCINLEGIFKKAKLQEQINAEIPVN